MGKSTGHRYLERLSARRLQVFIEGEAVTGDIAEHAAFRGGADTTARMLDLQDALPDQLTFASPETGKPVSAMFRIPRTQDDLVRRREAVQAVTDRTHGFLQRSSDYMNSALTALSAAKSFFDGADPVFGDRIARYVDLVRDRGLVTAHALLPPQSNRTASAGRDGARVAARIVEEREDGVIVRGARALATGAPVADELLVFPSTIVRGVPQDAPYSYAFAIPVDAPGLKYYCRASEYGGGSRADEPLASRFDEIDALVVFDDVFVPNDRIFMLGNARLRNEWYTATGARELMMHQSACRTLAKTEFYLGLASEIATALGIDGEQQVQQQLGELIGFLETVRALLRAAEADGSLNADGVFLPRWEPLNTLRNWYPETVAPRLTSIILRLAAPGMLSQASAADLENPDARDDLERFSQGARADAETRIRLMRLARDASISGFAGRDSLAEQFALGDHARRQAAVVGSYDLAPARARVQTLLSESG